MIRYCIAAGSVLGVMFFGTAVAQAAEVPLDVQVRLFFKIATYDANLPPGSVRVGIVAPASDTPGMKQILAAFDGLKNMTVNGRPLSTVAVPYTSAADVVTAYERGGGLYGIFVASSVPDTEVSALREVAKKYGLFSFAQKEAHVALGLTSGIALESDRRIVLLNVPVAIEQGRQFDGNFIKACRVIR